MKKSSTTPRSPLFSSLRFRFTVTCVGLLTVSLFLAIALLVIHGRTYQSEKQSLEALTIYQDVLIAANAISAERGPTNALLGGDYPPSDKSWLRLQRFRKNTDLALHRIAGEISNSPLNPSSAELTKADAELAKARTRIDALLNVPFKERPISALRDAITGMFKAVDAIKPMINGAALDTQGGAISLVDEALIGQKLLEIRDYAGRLGSILTPYIAWSKPLDVADQDSLQQCLGRTQELWELTKPYLERYPELSPDIANVEIIFFGRGLALINRLNHEGTAGNFSFSTLTMTNSLVPTFAPLEAIRLAYLDFMLRQSKARVHSAQIWFILVSILACVIVVIDIALIASMQRMIFEPLLAARDSIVALSEEGGTPLHFNPRSEIDEVFFAIEVLAARMLDRKNLLERLKFQATTDGLTGLLNRGALDQIGFNDPPYLQLPTIVGLILVDIDRFKSINDVYGHAIGDRALKSIASILRENCRTNDVVARFGGEEFAIIMPISNIQKLFNIANDLRAAIEKFDIGLGDDQCLHITASFGVAIGQRGNPDWGNLIKKADSALYAAKNGGRNQVCSANGEA